MRLASVIVLGSLALAVVARADAIPGPPMDCAPGSSGMSSHAGSWCEDTTCATDADCASSLRCREVSSCVPPGTTASGPQRADSPRGSYTVPGRRVSGSCEGGTSCAGGDVCERALRCVSASYVPPASPSGAPAARTTPPTEAAVDHSGGCGVAPTHARSIVAAWALALFAFARRARTRRARVTTDA